MTHLAATVPPPPQALYAMHRNAGAGYLQQRSAPLRKPVYRKRIKNFLENVNKVFHYSVIGSGTLIRPVAANVIASP